MHRYGVRLSRWTQGGWSPYRRLAACTIVTSAAPPKRSNLTRAATGVLSENRPSCAGSSPPYRPDGSPPDAQSSLLPLNDWIANAKNGLASVLSVATRFTRTTIVFCIVIWVGE